MKTLDCFVAEDEEPARNLLELYAERHPRLRLAGSAADGRAALDALAETRPDLLFLDIQMPGLTGLELLRAAPDPPVVIFTTAYPDYAVAGFELDAADYLLKPFSYARFAQAVGKAERLLNAAPAAPEPTGFVTLKADHKLHRVPWGDIRYIKGEREYAAFYLREGRLLALRALRQLEEELPEALFIRAHKSYIVARGEVAALEGNMLRLRSGETLPVGQTHKARVVAELFPGG